MKTNKIIIYDFDGTLTPDSLPKFEILEKSGLKNGLVNPLFLKKVQEKVQITNMDFYKAIYKTYFEIIKEAGFQLIDTNISLGADKVQYNKGVTDFLKKLHQHNIKNYLLSSGLEVYLQKTDIAPLFIKIYATIFKYNDNKEAIGIEYLMSDKNKVEAIKDILKDNNSSLEDCSNIIYVGDGLTDFYAMEYVKKHGGTTVFVYHDENSKDIDSMKEKNVVSFYTLADFSLGSDLNNYIMNLCNIKSN